jgi:hypothetical protein
MPHPAAARQSQPSIAEFDADWARNGWLARGEYIQLRRITASVEKSGSMSDKELDWTLGIMRGSSSPVVHARVMAMLGMLGRSKPLSKAQHDKIASAIAPFLHCRDDLDQRSAARVDRALTTPPRR